jgi:hypothetical protein
MQNINLTYVIMSKQMNGESSQHNTGQQEVQDLLFTRTVFAVVQHRSVDITRKRYSYCGCEAPDSVVLGMNMFRTRHANCNGYVTLCAMCRYIMIVHHSVYSRIYKKVWIGAMIAFCWVLSFGMQIPTLLGVWGESQHNSDDDGRMDSCMLKGCWVTDRSNRRQLRDEFMRRCMCGLSGTGEMAAQRVSESLDACVEENS